MADFLVVAAESNLRAYHKGESKTAVETGVSNVRVHPKYEVIQNQKYDWDLALLELDKSLLISNNEYIEAALLPHPDMRHTNKTVRVGGWGRTGAWFSPSLDHRAIDITIMDDRECLNIYNGLAEFIPTKMFCAGREGKTTCGGDSGAGAIFHDWGIPILLGVVSFGTRGCSAASVFPKIEKALPWIYKETPLR